MPREDPTRCSFTVYNESVAKCRNMERARHTFPEITSFSGDGNGLDSTEWRLGPLLFIALDFSIKESFQSLRGGSCRRCYFFLPSSAFFSRRRLLETSFVFSWSEFSKNIGQIVIVYRRGQITGLVTPRVIPLFNFQFEGI